MPTAAELSAVVANFRAIVATILTEQFTDGETVINGHPINIAPGALPAVCMDMVTIRTREPGEPDSALGTWDWYLELPVEIYVDATEDVQNPAIATARAERMAAQVLCAIAGDPQLANRDEGGLYQIVEAVFSAAEPFVSAFNREPVLPVLGYETSLHAWLLISQTT